MKLHNYRFVFLVSTLSLINTSGVAASNHTQQNSNGTAHERTIKKAKVQIPTSSDSDCGCDHCIEIRYHALSLHDHNYMIAQTLMATQLPTVLTDIIYDYAGHNLLTYTKWDVNSEEENDLYCARNDQKVSKIQLAVYPNLDNRSYYKPPSGHSINLDKGSSTLRPKELIHIVPQEASFNHLTFLQGTRIVFKHQAPKILTIRSLCGNYCIHFEFQKIIVSLFSPKLSQSSGWKLAFKESHRSSHD